MDDTLGIIIAIGLVAILMFVFPLMATAERTDDISQLAVQTETTKFVDKVRTTGQLTLEDYDKFYSTIVDETSDSFDIEMTPQILDENPGVKTTQAEITKIGENFYYTEYTTQVLEELNENNKKVFKDGDIFAVTVRNTNKTIAQLLKNFFYRISGDDTYQIAAQHSGIVTVNGSR